MIAYPWAGETPRPRYCCALVDLLFALACVELRFTIRWRELERVNTQ